VIFEIKHQLYIASGKGIPPHFPPKKILFVSMLRTHKTCSVEQGDVVWGADRQKCEEAVIACCKESN